MSYLANLITMINRRPETLDAFSGTQMQKHGIVETRDYSLTEYANGCYPKANAALEGILSNACREMLVNCNALLAGQLSIAVDSKAWQIMLGLLKLPFSSLRIPDAFAEPKYTRPHVSCNVRTRLVGVTPSAKP